RLLSLLLMLPRPPTPPLFPYTTLFRSLPIAMIILSLTVVPFFYRANVYTAYEFLEKRFDVKTRTLTAALFLAQRGLSCGVIIARSEEHTSELQSLTNLVCRLLLAKKKK